MFYSLNRLEKKMYGQHLQFSGEADNEMTKGLGGISGWTADWAGGGDLRLSRESPPPTTEVQQNNQSSPADRA